MLAASNLGACTIVDSQQIYEFVLSLKDRRFFRAVLFFCFRLLAAVVPEVQVLWLLFSISCCSLVFVFGVHYCCCIIKQSLFFTATVVYRKYNSTYMSLLYDITYLLNIYS